MKFYKYILLLIELKLTEWTYNLILLQYGRCKNLVDLIELRLKIEEIRNKINQL